MSFFLTSMQRSAFLHGSRFSACVYPRYRLRTSFHALLLACEGLGKAPCAASAALIPLISVSGHPRFSFHGLHFVSTSFCSSLQGFAGSDEDIPSRYGHGGVFGGS